MMPAQKTAVCSLAPRAPSGERDRGEGVVDVPRDQVLCQTSERSSSPRPSPPLCGREGGVSLGFRPLCLNSMSGWRQAAAWMAAVLIAAVPAAAANLPAVSEPAPGLVYRNDRIRTVPWSVHLLLIDRARLGFEWVTTLQPNRMLGLGPLTEQVRAIPPDLGRPLAAMNGDFYRLEN